MRARLRVRRQGRDRIHLDVSAVARSGGAGAGVRHADARSPRVSRLGAAADDRQRRRGSPRPDRSSRTPAWMRPLTSPAWCAQEDGARVPGRLRHPGVAARAESRWLAVLRLADEAVRVHGHGQGDRGVESRSDWRGAAPRRHRVDGAAGRCRRPGARAGAPRSGSESADGRSARRRAATCSRTTRGARTCRRSSTRSTRASARSRRMSRRLLAISWDMPPLSGPRAVQVSRTLKHLVPLGWESSVVCFGPRSRPIQSGSRAGVAAAGARRGHARAGALARRAAGVPGAVARRCRRSSCCRTKSGSGLARRRARRSVSPAERRFDVLVSFAQPWSDHLIGLRVHRATGLPWVAHFSDPWTDSPYLRGRRWQRRIWARMEADVVRHADARGVREPADRRTRDGQVPR